MIKKFSSILVVVSLLHAPLGGILQKRTSEIAPNSLYSIKQDLSAIDKAVSKVVNNDPVHTNWTMAYGRDIWKQNTFNKDIERAVKVWDKLDPLIFKSLMAQESGFRTSRTNRYGYTGIVQLGETEAREAGLVVRNGCDQRKTPYYAIPAAAKLLKQKAMHLYQHGFAKYGMPVGDEYWKFVAAAYNAGEGTIVKAMNHAYGNVKPGEVRFDDLINTKTGNPWDSALVKAMPRSWKKVAKYKEISTYARDVVARARQNT